MKDTTGENAVSVFIRLGFAHKKEVDVAQRYHTSWMDSFSPAHTSPLLPLTVRDTPTNDTSSMPSSEASSPDPSDSLVGMSSSGVFQKRLAFLFDSTLTAFLMMGNLSPNSVSVFIQLRFAHKKEVDVAQRYTIPAGWIRSLPHTPHHSYPSQ